MAKKNNKPYKNQVNSRTININNKGNGNNKSKLTTTNSVNNNFENTIKIDSKRLNDYETLDTSFLEGRVENKEKYFIDKERKNTINKIFKTIVISILLLIILVLLVFGIVKTFNDYNRRNKKKIVEIEDPIVEKTKVLEDDNVLFLGDMYTAKLNLDDLAYPNVKVSDEDYRLEDINNDLNYNIYRYNPSVLFISLGNNDIKEDISKEDMLNYFEELIVGVKENRPYCDIYVESLYPVKDDNEEIIEFNKELEKLVKRLDVKYIDIFIELSKEDKLNDAYFDDDDDLLNEEGYKKILKRINKVMDDVKW